MKKDYIISGVSFDFVQREPYFENERLGELGWSLEDKVSKEPIYRERFFLLF
jgi:hypothetical protein